MMPVRPTIAAPDQRKTQPFPTVRSLLRSGVTLLLLVASLSLSVPAFGEGQPVDSRLFLTGFDLYQKKEYDGATAQLKELLASYPDSPLRDMAIFWLSRTYYRSGNQQEAARLYSQLVREYPDTPLKGMVDDEFRTLVGRYERGEKLPTRAGSAAVPAG